MGLAMGLILTAARSVTFEQYVLDSSFCCSFHLLRWCLRDVHFAVIALCFLHPVSEAAHPILCVFPNYSCRDWAPEGGTVPLAGLWTLV